LEAYYTRPFRLIIMLITINQDVNDTSELSDLLKHIAGLVDEGYTSGHTPSWLIINNSEDKNGVGELLTAVYNNHQRINVLAHVSQEDLKEFIVEIFNKGILNDYLELKK
jgi:hypothetical protein